jgi:hypothetical protein
MYGFEEEQLKASYGFAMPMGNFSKTQSNHVRYTSKTQSNHVRYTSIIKALPMKGCIHASGL